jgi:hypothetical protein
MVVVVVDKDRIDGSADATNVGGDDDDNDGGDNDVG